MKKTPVATWIKSFFKNQLVPDDVRREVRSSLRVAGIREVTDANLSLVTKLAQRAVNGMQQARTLAVATVVTADGVCPRCGSPMTDVRIASRAGKVCTNARCRTSAWIEE